MGVPGEETCVKDIKADKAKLLQQERESWLRTLRGLRLPDAPERAALGCVVGIGPPDGPSERLYFILPVCGGMEIPVQDDARSIRVVTPETPVAKALLGKSLGDEVRLRNGQDRPDSVRLLV